MNNSPVFIIGHPKSGTSLMTALLDSHPQLVVLSEESDFYLNVWPRAKILNWEWRLSNREKVRILMEQITCVSHIKNYFRGRVDNDISGNLDYRNFDHISFRKKLENMISSMRTFKRRELLLGIIRSYSEILTEDGELESKRWVEKTAKNTWFIEQILRDFPDASFIFIYRDPRDNFISYKKKLGKGMDAIKFSKSWNTSFKEASKIDPSRVIYIKYEELVNDVQNEMRKIAEFLDIKYTEHLTRPTKLGVAWQGNSMFGTKSETVQNSSSGRYKEMISSEDLFLLEAFCGSKMEELNYPLENPPTELTDIRVRFGTEYDSIYPFGINHSYSLRKILGELRIKLTGRKP